MQAFSVEPVAALVSRLVKPDGGRLLLADPLERTRKHRCGCMYSLWGPCTAGQLVWRTFGQVSFTPDGPRCSPCSGS